VAKFFGQRVERAGLAQLALTRFLERGITKFCGQREDKQSLESKTKNCKTKTKTLHENRKKLRKVIRKRNKKFRLMPYSANFFSSTSVSSLSNCLTS